MQLVSVVEPPELVYKPPPRLTKSFAKRMKLPVTLPALLGVEKNSPDVFENRIAPQSTINTNGASLVVIYKIIQPGLPGIVPLRAGDGQATTIPWRVVGPVCESSDDFGEHLLPRVPPSHVAILDAGAYGSVMSSTYNARPYLPIALVDGDRWATIRDRQKLPDMWENERIPDFLA